MRLAALDLGSNSFHLLVVDATRPGGLEVVLREKEMLRLGDDVGRLGRITESRSQAAVETATRLAALARSVGARAVYARATAAFREASNGRRVAARITHAAGVHVEILSGVDEALLTFEGVTGALDLSAPGLVADLGGGSLELVAGDNDGPTWVASLPLGVARLTAEITHSDPPGSDDLDRTLERVREALAPHLEAVRALDARCLVGTSGTIITLARLVGARRPAARATALSASRSELVALRDELVGLALSERENMSGLDPRRADTIIAGVIVVLELLDSFGFEQLRVSPWGLREGILLNALSSAGVDQEGSTA